MEESKGQRVEKSKRSKSHKLEKPNSSGALEKNENIVSYDLLDTSTFLTLLPLDVELYTLNS